MAESLTNAWPWPARGQAKADSAETTPGGSEGVRWVVVAASLSPAEAAIIKGRLESEQIPALVQQEAVGIVLGLTVGPLGSAKVLVPEPQAEQAIAILSVTFEPDEAEADEN